MGVSLARRLGPRFSLRDFGVGRPGFRQRPAAPIDPGLAHAPERAAAYEWLSTRRCMPGRPGGFISSIASRGGNGDRDFLGRLSHNPMLNFPLLVTARMPTGAKTSTAVLRLHNI